jgi:hypothetical protein
MSGSRVMQSRRMTEMSVIGKRYFARQAATLLKFARSTNDPRVAGALIEKAADLKSRSDEELSLSDATPLAPDIEPPPPS